MGCPHADCLSSSFTTSLRGSTIVAVRVRVRVRIRVLGLEVRLCLEFKLTASNAFPFNCGEVAQIRAQTNHSVDKNGRLHLPTPTHLRGAIDKVNEVHRLSD